uniref:Uncharacterized protein n=1 Tax=Arion vulgaris TaxID=1028688 RepID=A0A0B6Y5S2_9EUPU
MKYNIIRKVTVLQNYKMAKYIRQSGHHQKDHKHDNSRNKRNMKLNTDLPFSHVKT